MEAKGDLERGDKEELYMGAIRSFNDGSPWWIPIVLVPVIEFGAHLGKQIAN